MTLEIQPPAEPEPLVEQSDPITLAVELLVRTGVPGAGVELVREHTPDRSGRCSGCPHATTLAPRHPCLLRLVGERLVDLESANPGGSS